MACILLGTRGRIGSQTLIADEFEPTIFPVSAVERARAEGLQGRLFSEFAWGGYVVYAWPEQKVFIDGGTDFFGAELFREYATIKRMIPGWRALLSKWDFSLMLLRRESNLAHELARQPDWQLWYCDSLAVLMQRRKSTTTSHASGNPDSSEARLDTCAASGSLGHPNQREAPGKRDVPQQTSLEPQDARQELVGDGRFRAYIRTRNRGRPQTT
jgi:hypothetical protein